MVEPTAESGPILATARGLLVSAHGLIASRGITLLGILPNLPDRLSDPEQAAIAAHCVHQIRTMLQINGGVEGGERRVFAVTSASPGDGKTSLTLALGPCTTRRTG